MYFVSVHLLDETNIRMLFKFPFSSPHNHELILFMSWLTIFYFTIFPSVLNSEFSYFHCWVCLTWITWSPFSMIIYFFFVFNNLCKFIYFHNLRRKYFHHLKNIILAHVHFWICLSMQSCLYLHNLFGLQ